MDKYSKEFRCKFKYYDIKFYKLSFVNMQCVNLEIGMYSFWFNIIYCMCLFFIVECNNSFLENYVDSFCNLCILLICIGKLSK